MRLGLRIDLGSREGGVPAEPRRNLFTTATQDFSSAAWTKIAVTVTADADVGPFGAATADALTPTGVDSSVQRNWTPTVVSPHTLSIYLRSNTGADVVTQLRLTRVSPFGSITTAPITVTTAWQRFTITGTPLDTTTHNWYIGSSSTFSTGENIFADAAQYEVGSSASAFQA